MKTPEGQDEPVQVKVDHEQCPSCHSNMLMSNKKLRLVRCVNPCGFTETFEQYVERKAFERVMRDRAARARAMRRMLMESSYRIALVFDHEDNENANLAIWTNEVIGDYDDVLQDLMTAKAANMNLTELLIRLISFAGLPEWLARHFHEMGAMELTPETLRELVQLRNEKAWGAGCNEALGPFEHGLGNHEIGYVAPDGTKFCKHCKCKLPKRFKNVSA